MHSETLILYADVALAQLEPGRVTCQIKPSQRRCRARLTPLFWRHINPVLTA